MHFRVLITIVIFEMVIFRWPIEGELVAMKSLLLEEWFRLVPVHRGDAFPTTPSYHQLLDRWRGFLPGYSLLVVASAPASANKFSPLPALVPFSILD